MGWLQGKEARNKVIRDICLIFDEMDIKCLCGKVLTASMLRSTKIGNEYWVFARCPKCKFDFNYEKILRQYQAIKGVTLN